MLARDHPWADMSAAACELHCELLAALMDKFLAAWELFLYQPHTNCNNSHQGISAEEDTEVLSRPVRHARNALKLFLPAELIDGMKDVVKDVSPFF